jgi:hypothetical protein
MKFLFLFASSLLCQAQKSATMALFNGKSFDDWYMISEDNSPAENFFTVTDGTIHAYPSQESGSDQPFGAIVTKKEYENYVLTLDFKWGEKKFAPRANDVRDAGVLIHMFGGSVIWPAGIECQIQEGDCGDLWIIKARASSKVDSDGYHNYSPEGHLVTKGHIDEYHRISRSNSWEQPGWNKVKVTGEGNNAKFYINEKLVNEAINVQQFDHATQKWRPLTTGKILLQAEGSEVFYRDISIQDVSK